MSPLDWMRRDTEPTPEEIRSFEGLPEVLRDAAARDSEPLDEEVHALAAWRPEPAQIGAWPLVGLLVPVVLAALLIAVWWMPERAETNPYRSTGIASWEARAEGPVTTVVQGLGSRTWEVDPVAPSGTFRVVAGDVTVTVLGTLFTVVHSPPEVRVEVQEGRVQVDHPWGRAVLSAGEVWSRIDAMPEKASVAAVRTTRDPEIEVAPETPVASPTTAAPPLAAATPSSAFAAALARFDQGERSTALAKEFAALAERLDAPLSQEAEAISLQVGARAWPATEARTALTAWLDTHPRAPRRWAVLEARADLERSRLKRCELALPTYTALTARPDRAGKARAYAWQGLCSSALGDTELARKAMGAALELGVSGMLREEIELALAGFP